jgi:hypothetical protein
MLESGSYRSSDTITFHLYLSLGYSSTTALIGLLVIEEGDIGPTRSIRESNYVLAVYTPRYWTLPSQKGHSCMETQYVMPSGL